MSFRCRLYPVPCTLYPVPCTPQLQLGAIPYSLFPIPYSSATGSRSSAIRRSALLAGTPYRSKK
jgi:hypothetical protein